jgi:hypothetical protein
VWPRSPRASHAGVWIACVVSACSLTSAVALDRRIPHVPNKWQIPIAQCRPRTRSQAVKRFEGLHLSRLACHLGSEEDEGARHATDRDSGTGDDCCRPDHESCSRSTDNPDERRLVPGRCRASAPRFDRLHLPDDHDSKKLMLAFHRPRPLNVVGRIATAVWSAARDVDGHGCAGGLNPPAVPFNLAIVGPRQYSQSPLSRVLPHVTERTSVSRSSLTKARSGLRKVPRMFSRLFAARLVRPTRGRLDGAFARHLSPLNA